MEDDARYRRLAASATLVNIMLLRYDPPRRSHYHRHPTSEIIRAHDSPSLTHQKQPGLAISSLAVRKASGVVPRGDRTRRNLSILEVLKISHQS